MASYVGQRLSFDGDRCIVRYVGRLRNKAGDWLGVEWDDGALGKHEGSHEGVQYFSCHSASPTAGSFIRPARPSDIRATFLQAMEEKYASSSAVVKGVDDTIHISGKTVEEVGFEKIQRQLSSLTELKTVILDGRCVTGLSQEARRMEEKRPSDQRLRHMKVEQLDLSRNLLETWADVVMLISALPRLRMLNLAGNRFYDISISPNSSVGQDPIGIAELGLDETLLSFTEIASLIRTFSSLSTLTVSQNRISSTIHLRENPKLSRLDLSFNDISTIEDISSLATLPHLAQLSLRSNPIASLEHPTVIFKTLAKLDLTSTLLPSPSSLNPILRIFPNLSHLLMQSTPLATLPSASLFTIARIPSLTELNFSPITAAERQNAELYYMSTITTQLTAATSPGEQRQILSPHPRWDDLCQSHGAPDIPRKAERKERHTPGTLGARVAKFEFHISEDFAAKATTARDQDDEARQAQLAAEVGLDQISMDEERRQSLLEYSALSKTRPLPPAGTRKVKLIPTATSTYRLLGLVATLFGLDALHIRLILETDEFDPVGEEDGGWSVSEDDSDDSDREGQKKPQQEEKEKGQWMRRELELVGSTKPVGDWLPVGFGDMRIVKVRVEHD